MKFRYYILLIIVVLSYSATAQSTIEISAGSMYGNFSMKDMNTLQNSLYREMSDLGINPKATEKFPSYWGATASIAYNYNNQYSLGAFFNQTSTGGRITYRDYSGFFQADQLLSVYNIGLFASRNILPDSAFLSVYLGGKLSAAMTNLSIKSDFGITSGSISREAEYFKAANFCITPFVEVRKYMFKRSVFLSASLGYEVNAVLGKLIWQRDTDAVLRLDRGGDAKADWSGVRLNVSLGVSIKS